MSDCAAAVVSHRRRRDSLSDLRRQLSPAFEPGDSDEFAAQLDLRRKDAIWQMIRRHFELESEQCGLSRGNWTGAEIRTCCRLAALLDVPLVQAAQNVVPVAVTSAESVERLRQWASGRCLSADKAGIYSIGKRSGPRRRVSRDPSNN